MTQPLPRALLVALLLSPGCLRDPITDEPDGPTVEPEYYALGLCSLKCYRLVECGQLAEAEHGTCEDACVEETLEALSGDACWEAWVEVRRCNVRNADCSDVEAETLPAADEATCAARQDMLDACDG
jgi:hypothetical protein